MTHLALLKDGRSLGILQFPSGGGVGSSQAAPRWNLSSDNNNEKDKHLLSAFSMSGIISYLYYFIKSFQQTFEVGATLSPLYGRGNRAVPYWSEVTWAADREVGQSQIFLPDVRDPDLKHHRRGQLPCLCAYLLLTAPTMTFPFSQLLNFYAGV